MHSPVIEDFVDRWARKLDSGEAALPTEVINRNASAHFVGGIPIGENSESGAVDPYLRLHELFVAIGMEAFAETRARRAPRDRPHRASELSRPATT